MTLEEMFEYAWYCSLNDLEYAAAMVGCGVKALESGLDAPEVCELAGADELEDAEFRALFRRTAAAVGVSLPAPDRARTWCARLANKLERDRFATLRTTQQITEDDLWLAHELLRNRASSQSNAALAAFTQHLGLYVKSEIENYENWLVELRANCDSALETQADDSTKAMIDGVTDLIHWLSYGAVTGEHAKRSSELLGLGQISPAR